MSNWIRPHRFGKLSCFLNESDSCLASVPAGVVLVLWAGVLRNCIMFPIPWTAEPLYPTLWGTTGLYWEESFKGSPALSSETGGLQQEGIVLDYGWQ